MVKIFDELYICGHRATMTFIWGGERYGACKFCIQRIEKLGLVIGYNFKIQDVIDVYQKCTYPKGVIKLVDQMGNYA